MKDDMSGHLAYTGEIINTCKTLVRKHHLGNPGVHDTIILK
jgi:hypothetical protein